jgi:hypothetical protein
MFTRAFSESSADEVVMHEIAPTGFQVVLTFLYAGEVHLLATLERAPPYDVQTLLPF